MSKVRPSVCFAAVWGRKEHSPSSACALAFSSDKLALREQDSQKGNEEKAWASAA